MDGIKSFLEVETNNAAQLMDAGVLINLLENAERRALCEYLGHSLSSALRDSGLLRSHVTQARALLSMSLPTQDVREMGRMVSR